MAVRDTVPTRVSLEDGSYVNLDIGKHDTTDEVVATICQKVVLRDGLVSTDYTLAEMRGRTVLRKLLAEEWPLSTFKSKVKETFIELILVPVKKSLEEINQSLERRASLDSVSSNESRKLRGWLTKRGHDYRAAWKRRWCSVEGNLMRYFEDAPSGATDSEGKKHKGDINLDGCSVTICNSVGKANCFQISNTIEERDYYFCTESVESLNEWRFGLRNASLINLGTLSTGPERLAWILGQKSVVDESLLGCAGLGIDTAKAFESNLQSANNRYANANQKLVEATTQDNSLQLAEREAREELARLRELLSRKTTAA